MFFAHTSIETSSHNVDRTMSHYMVSKTSRRQNLETRQHPTGIIQEGTMAIVALGIFQF